MEGKAKLSIDTPSQNTTSLSNLSQEQQLIPSAMPDWVPVEQHGLTSLMDELVRAGNSCSVQMPLSGFALRGQLQYSLDHLGATISQILAQQDLLNYSERKLIKVLKALAEYTSQSLPWPSNAGPAQETSSST